MKPLVWLWMTLSGTLMLDQFQATGKSDLNMQKAVPDQFWGCQDMAQLDKLLKGVANPSQGILLETQGVRKQAPAISLPPRQVARKEQHAVRFR